MIKSAKDVIADWMGPNDDSYCSRQISIRLTKANESDIQTLCKRFTSQSRTKIINDLLRGAIDDVMEELKK